MTQNKFVGLSLAICAALAVTTVVTSAEALSCAVTKVRVTTRTLNYDIDPMLLTPDSAAVIDNNASLQFYFGTTSVWHPQSFWLNNVNIEDFREGAIDEFEKTFTTPYPVFPTNFQRLRIANWANGDIWGMSGLKFEIMCSGGTQWYTIYTNRGLYKRLATGIPNIPSEYVSAVGPSAGSDAYSGSHEVFWLTNIGDNNADGILDDLANCNDAGGTTDVECRVRAILTDINRNPVVNAQWPLTESWWDVGNSTFVNPLEAKYGELYTNPDTGDPEETDNFWRWFWTSGEFTHSAVKGARLTLDSCVRSPALPEGPCTMQTNYVHATVMQAWGDPLDAPYPYFWSHIYEGDHTTAPSSGWLSVAAAGAPPTTDFAMTSSSRFSNFSGGSFHVESLQDSEHTSQQMATTCGYKSTDMILSTRGFPYEMIHDPAVSLFNEPAYAGALDWEDAIAVAHLVWGYKTMCCGWWDCCPDASNCASNLPGSPLCRAANIADWWTSLRCDFDDSLPLEKWCFGGSGDIDDDGLDRWLNPPPSGNPADRASDRLFWRDTRTVGDWNPVWPFNWDIAMDGWVEEWERFTGLIDGDGVIHWEGYPGVDDDFDGDTDEGVLPFDPVEDPAKWEFYSRDKVTEPYFINDGRDDAVGIRGAISEVLQKFLRDLAMELPTPISTQTGTYAPTACNINPTGNYYFSGTKSVITSLDYGYGALMAWNHRLDGECGPSSHYSVIDGYERIYHPSTPAHYDYFFFIGDPNAPVSSAMTEYNFEGMDDLGFDLADFQSSVTGITFWNYDFYK